MSSRKKQKGFNFVNALIIVLSVLVGAALGLFVPRQIDSMMGDGLSEAAVLLGFFIGIWIALFLQIIVHEGGHLVFGLLTGYRFCSFRIGSLMWIKQGTKIKLRRMSLAGTGGQCLMAPPDMVDGRIPVMLYNFGGTIANAAVSVMFLLIFIFAKDVPLLSVFSLTVAVFGLVLAAANGFPMRTGTVDNDGYNALSLGKDASAMRSFWIQLKVNIGISEGLRLRDMPSEWFCVPSDEEMKNSMTSVMGVFACNRLMDEHRFEEAETLMTRLLEADTAMIGIHRSMMTCDLIYCELIGENRSARLQSLLNAAQRKFMRAMRGSPSIRRTEYAYALLAENDRIRADKLASDFRKTARTYPYLGELESERELIRIAEQHQNIDQIS